MNKMQTINDMLGTFITASNLSALTEIFIAVLLPTVILLLETVSHDSWDRLVLINKVINLRNVFLSVCLMAISMFLWYVPYVRLVLFICYLAGLGIMLRVLWISMLWLMDWTESPSTGVKYRLRREILTDQKITQRERLNIWQQYLASISSISGKQVVGFTDSRLFFEVFKKDYFDLPANREEFLQITKHYLEGVLNKRDSHEMEFVSFAFGEFFHYAELSKKASIRWSWKAILDIEFKSADHNEERAVLLFHTINSQIPKHDELNAKWKAQVLSSLLFQLLLHDSFVTIDNNWLKGTPWRIDFHQITEENIRGLLQSSLLHQFVKYVNKLDTANYSELNKENNGKTLDRVIKVAFKQVNPIVLYRIYTLFRTQNLRALNEDWSKVLLESINNVPLFGYYDDMEILDESSNISLKEFIRKNDECEYKESIRISVMSLRSLHDSMTGPLIRKIRDALSSSMKDEKLSINYPRITTDDIRMYLRLLEELAYEVYTEEQSYKNYIASEVYISV